jgi:glutathione synthase/RimK-type ligase-like ATP-grasp enzyme
MKKPKKILFSARQNHDIIGNVIEKLKNVKEIEFILHDPSKDFLDLENLPNMFKDIDMLIVKAGGESSIDLLHFAKLYNIPTLHDIDLVLLLRNKVALDQALRKIFQKYSNDLKKFSLPKSWTQNVSNEKIFKKWASKKLPIVIKSHYQHDKYMRFNFLVRKIEEIDKFIKKYSAFLYYDVYVQEFIECDGVDRKVYVIGDKTFGIKRENPIYIYMRNKPEDIDVDTIDRETIEVSEDMKKLAQIISKELNLKIFGVDLIKPIDKDEFYLIDLNEFPGLRGIKNIEAILADFIINTVIS